MVSFIHVFISESIGVIDSEILFKFNICLSLLRGSHICMIRVVEPLLLQNFLYPLYVFHYFYRHLLVGRNVFVERNEFNTCDQVNEVGRRHFGHEFPICDNNDENVGFNVYYADDALCRKLDTTLVIKFFFHYLDK